VHWIPLRELRDASQSRKALPGSRRPASPGWKCAGELAHLHGETLRIQKIIDEELNKSNLRTGLDSGHGNALSAYLDRTPEAVEIVSEAREIAIP